MALPPKGILGDVNVLRDPYREALQDQRDQIAFLGTLWEPDLPYPHPSMSRGPDGKLYDSVQPSLGQNPTADVIGTYWTPYKSFGHAGDQINLPYKPTTQQMTERRMLQRNGASLLDTDFPALLASFGGKIYGSVDSTHFNLPDDRGLFERIWDDGAGVDPDTSTRTDRGDGATGDNVGTLQGPQIESHDHTIVNATGVGGVANTLQRNQTASVAAGATTGDTGGNETRPKNRYKWGGIFY